MKTVLVVDDESSLAFALELLLSGAGYKVLTAFSAEDGLLIAKDATPHLIILDIMMPGMGGLEGLKLLKTLPQLRTIPVILISGARPLVRQADFKWSTFLHKPFSAEMLIAEVKKLIDD